jgi:hypothetical protein
MRPTMKPEANDQSYFGMAFPAGHGDPDSCAGAGRTTVVALSPIFAEPTVYGAHAVTPCRRRRRQRRAVVLPRQLGPTPLGFGCKTPLASPPTVGAG